MEIKEEEVADGVIAAENFFGAFRLFADGTHTLFTADLSEYRDMSIVELKEELQNAQDDLEELEDEIEDDDDEENEALFSVKLKMAMIEKALDDK